MLGSGSEGNGGLEAQWWGDPDCSCSTWSGGSQEGLQAGHGCHRGPSPVDEVLFLITLHLVLNGGLQVPDALERQFQISL